MTATEDRTTKNGHDYVLAELVAPVQTVNPTHEPEVEFTYFDIGSIDSNRGRVGDAKRVMGRDAPSRARRAVEGGDVLVSLVRPALRGVALLAPSERGIASTGFCVLRARDGVDPRYLSYVVRSTSVTEVLTASQRGMSYPAVTQKDVLSLRLIVPSLSTQRRLADFLDESLSVVEEAENQLNRAQEALPLLKDALLREATLGELTRHWRSRQNVDPTWSSAFLRELEAARVSALEAGRGAGRKRSRQESRAALPLGDIQALPPLPDTWFWATAESLGDIKPGVMINAQRAVDSNGTYKTVPYLRVANVQRGFLLLEDIRSIAIKKDRALELALKVGDVLFTEGGDRDKLGRGWLWEGQLDECIHQNHIFRLRPFSGSIVPALISHHGNTFGKFWFTQAGRQTTNLASINLSVLRRFPVPVAPPAEQLEIARLLKARLEMFDQAVAQIEFGLFACARQRARLIDTVIPMLPEQGVNIAERHDSPPTEPRAKSRARPKSRREPRVKRSIHSVLEAQADWISGQELSRLCGLNDNSTTDQVEIFYAELRQLLQGRDVTVRPVKDTSGVKQYDEIRLSASRS